MQINKQELKQTKKIYLPVVYDESEYFLAKSQSRGGKSKKLTSFKPLNSSVSPPGINKKPILNARSNPIKVPARNLNNNSDYSGILKSLGIDEI